MSTWNRPPESRGFMLYPPRMVLDVSVRLCGCHWSYIVGTSRIPELVHARRKVVGALRSFTVASYPEVGRMLGRRWASTAVDQYQQWRTLPESERDDWLIRVEAALQAADKRRIVPTRA